MAKAKDELEVEDAVDVTPQDQQAQMMLTMANVLERLVDKNETGPIPQIPTARAILPTPWHPSGELSRPSLSRTTYLNGHRCREILMSNEEIVLCNGLKSGRYQNKRWTVVDTDGDGNAASLQIYLPNKTEADRLEQKSLARNFAEVLRMIHAEMAEREAAKSSR